MRSQREISVRGYIDAIMTEDPYCPAHILLYISLLFPTSCVRGNAQVYIRKQWEMNVE